MRGISVVIPTFNERGNIEVLLRKTVAVMKRFRNCEILVVDDNSPDGTAEAVRGFVKNRRIRLFVRNHKQGLSSAVKLGVNKSKYDTVCVLDADLFHRPETIMKMVDELKNADIVIASRFAKGSRINGMTLIRLIVSKTVNTFLRIIFPRLFHISDPLTGFFIFRKSILNNIKLRNIGFKILLEILIKANYGKISEVNSVFSERTSGQSKLTLSEYFLFSRLVAHLFFFQLFGKTRFFFVPSYKNSVMRQ